MFNEFFIRFSSDRIGFDEFGNSYYEERKIYNGKRRRFVIYNGVAEPSKIPAEWHGWIHYTTDIAPVEIKTHKSTWQKIHLPNLTGTKYAYFPFSNNLKGGKRRKVSSDYESWKPKE